MLDRYFIRPTTYSAHLNSPAFSQINSPPASKEKKRGLRSSHESEMIITLIRIAQDGRTFYTYKHS